MASDQQSLKLYAAWASPFSRRVELALKLKGVSYEEIQEDLSNKSPDLLKYNPIHKKVPVLVHNGKPIAESLVILEYIDETWKNNPILPQDPYDKAMARFWGSFIDNQILGAGIKLPTCEGEKEREAVVMELCENLKTLEQQLDGKDFFGGDKIGYVDIVGILVAFWFPVSVEAMGSDQFMTPETFPRLFKWIGKLEEIDVVNECRPPKDKHIAHIRARFATLQNAPK